MPVITLSSGARFSANVGSSILEAASLTQISLPYSCKTGRCSTCKCKLISGETVALYPEGGLTNEEKASGWILSCVRSAETDLFLEVDDLGGRVLPPARTFPCRISKIERMAADVVRVFLRLPPTADFKFIPGQYIDVIGTGGVRRSYSLATAGLANGLLEIHIRAVTGGAMSAYWFEHAKENDLLRLNGPLGSFFLRDSGKLDLIFLATGTGVAPVKAILETISDIKPELRPKSVTVLWGGRTPDDLYFDVGALSATSNYIPVLSKAEASWEGQRGHVQDILLRIMPDLSNAAVYACGSNAMIGSAKKVLVQAHLNPNRFYSDAFVCSDKNISQEGI